MDSDDPFSASTALIFAGFGGSTSGALVGSVVVVVDSVVNLVSEPLEVTLEEDGTVTFVEFEISKAKTKSAKNKSKKPTTRLLLIFIVPECISAAFPLSHICSQRWETAEGVKINFFQILGDENYGGGYWWDTSESVYLKSVE
jgi:hypothetical protein